ncbi:hypothetical protein V8Z74_19635 [Comamonas sp. w2-DMI]|uniref:hypothetical protein n=1 Tax=Comamonas sp. w2-DMI TaxID=3126391 RepID=UPI0032E46785
MSDSLGWPLVMRRNISGLGDVLIGQQPELSPDLAPAAWAQQTGTIGAAVSVGSWRDPYTPGFFSEAAGTASTTLALALGPNRGAAVYVGFGRYVPFVAGHPDPAYATDPGLALELLGEGGAVVARIAVTPGDDGDGSPMFTLHAGGAGLDQVELEGPIGVYEWRNAWLRTLALAVNEAGQLGVGWQHPGFGGFTDYRYIGDVPGLDIKSLRLAVSRCFCMTFIEVHKTGMRPVAAPLGTWWRNRVNAIEQGGGDGPAIPEDDWMAPI